MSRIAVCVLSIVLLAAALGLAADAPAAGTVNINTASEDQLSLLPRIGPTAAARIVEYRKAHGPFTAAEGLLQVKGIGEKTLDLLRPYVIVKGETTLKDKVHLSRKTQGMINSATVVGYLGADPELRTSADGATVTTFRVACTERWTDGEARREKTHWIRCKTFGGLARFCAERLRKGSRVGMRGVLDYSSWETAEGQRRSDLALKVLDLDWLDPRSAAGSTETSE